MKKKKVFGKAQFALVLMVLALGGAVWLNMHFSSEKYLGEAKLVGTTQSEHTVPTSAKVQDSFAEAVKSREKAYSEAKDFVKETLKSEKLSDADKQGALKKIELMAERIEKENNIETIIKAKGFEKCVAVLGDNTATVTVKSNGLTTAQTMQIQDTVIAETKIPLGNIKIVAVK